MRPYQKNNNMYTIHRNNIDNKSNVHVDTQYSETHPHYILCTVNDNTLNKISHDIAVSTAAANLTRQQT